MVKEGRQIPGQDRVPQDRRTRGRVHTATLTRSTQVDVGFVPVRVDAVPARTILADAVICEQQGPAIVDTTAVSTISTEACASSVPA